MSTLDELYIRFTKHTVAMSEGLCCLYGIRAEQPDTDPIRQAIALPRWRLIDRIAAFKTQASSAVATVQDKQTLAEAYGALNALQWALFVRTTLVQHQGKALVEPPSAL